METIFLTIQRKGQLISKLENGEKEAVKIVIKEIDRLEAVIKDYESAIGLLNSKFNSETFKTPEI